jgi:geranylgeranyl diphosphate synthase type II
MTDLSGLDAPRFLDRVRPGVEETLDAILPPADVPPVRIHEAMRYSVFAGGKRLRPALAVAAYSVFSNDWERVLPVAGAIELVHTYSLIHDDLPAMDDDDFRRGRPSCHRQYGEAVAILAGDALLTLAFQVLASRAAFPASRLTAVIGALAEAAGSRGGMIAGQTMDLEAQGGAAAWEVDAIHQAKTGALLEVSLRAGALLGGADPAELEAIGSFGRSIGLAFQVTDDILDEVGVVASLGKTPGKDARQGKVTYPRAYGLEASRAAVTRLTGEARRSLDRLGPRGSVLGGLADYLETRTR